MYNGAVTRVRTSGGIFDDLLNTIGLHQGSTLTVYLFVVVMDELVKSIQEEVTWCMCREFNQKFLTCEKQNK